MKDTTNFNVRPTFPGHLRHTIFCPKMASLPVPAKVYNHTDISHYNYERVYYYVEGHTPARAAEFIARSWLHR